MATIAELRELSDEELLDLLEDKKEESWLLRRDYLTGELKDTSRFGKVRKDIARAKTILRQRELAQELAEKEKQDA